MKFNVTRTFLSCLSLAGRRKHGGPAKEISHDGEKIGIGDSLNIKAKTDVG